MILKKVAYRYDASAAPHDPIVEDMTWISVRKANGTRSEHWLEPPSIEDDEGFFPIRPVVGIVLVVGSESNDFLEALRTRMG